MTEDRRIKNIDRFIVETFEDRACKIFVRINDQGNSSRFTRNRRRATENQTGNIIIDNELKTEEGRDRSHIDMPPIRAERQALDPFRAIDGSVRPFISHLRL